MTAPANPPATSVAATVPMLVAFLAEHPSDGVYIYTDSGHAPAGAGVPASDLNSALQTHYTPFANTTVTDKTQLTSFPDSNSFQVKAKGIIPVFEKLDDSEPLGKTTENELLWLDRNRAVTNKGIWYRIVHSATGQFVGKYVRYEEISLLTTENMNS